jgi:alpha-L-fucosidase
MYDSALSNWTAVKMGPKRDLIGDLAAAVRARGMVFGASTHREEHWWFMNGGRKFDSDVQDPKYADFYGPAQPDGTEPDAAYLEDWLARTCELVDKYRPQIVWFDWWINTPAFAPYLARFAAHYYNRGVQWGVGVAINYKEKAFPEGTAVLDLERGQLADIRPLLWQNDTSVIKNSWGYVENRDYKTAEAVVGDLIDVVSKNGALLLNIGPRADGTIPEEEEAILLDIGRWLEVNGEAIYETRPWKVFGEGPTQVEEGMFTDTKRAAFTSADLRFTARGDVLYAALLAWPEKGEAVIESLGTNLRLYTGEVERVELLGAAEPLEFTRDERALRVKLPAAKPCEHAYVLRIAKQGKS